MGGFDLDQAKNKMWCNLSNVFTYHDDMDFEIVRLGGGQ